MNTSENQLIAWLPRQDQRRLIKACERVQVVPEEVLCSSGENLTHAYFPLDAFMSLMSQPDGHAGVEVAMVGREGMLGLQLAWGVSAMPWRAMVRGAGSVWRIDVESLQEVMLHSVALQRAMSRYTCLMIHDLVTASACLHYHLIVQRLARWLLMSQDRAQSDALHITQENLSRLLGVRRVGITVAAGALQEQGLIQYRRGDLLILDRHALSLAACECYALDQMAYKGLFHRH